MDLHDVSAPTGYTHCLRCGKPLMNRRSQKCGYGQICKAMTKKEKEEIDNVQCEGSGKDSQSNGTD